MSDIVQETANAFLQHINFCDWCETQNSYCDAATKLVDAAVEAFLAKRQIERGPRDFREPWKYVADEQRIYDREGTIVRHDLLSRSELGQRIVACINLCAGLSTETIESSKDMIVTEITNEEAELIQ